MPISTVLLTARWGRALAKVNGFEIAYTNRGSWKAHRSINGKVIDEIPVAWDKDYEAGAPPKLTIWFKNPREAELAFGRGSFVSAIAKKRPDSASSEDITNLLEVKPIQLVAD
jgi:hypothetical protein